MLWHKLSYIGVKDDIPDNDSRKIIFTNRICAILSGVLLTSVIINLLLGSYFFIPVLLLAFLFINTNYLLNYYNFFLASRITIFFVLVALVLFMSFNGGYGSGLEFYFLALAVLPVILFNNKWLIFLCMLICAGCVIAQKFYVGTFPEASPNPVIEYKVFYVINSIYSSLLIVLAMLFYKNLYKKTEWQLRTSNKQIAEKNIMLEDANKQLDAFTYMVSHDLRSPIRSTEGFLSILRQKHSADLNEDARELLGMAMQNSARMREIINSLLDFSRTGKADIKHSILDMKALIYDVINQYKTNINESSAQIIVQDMPYVNADYVLIRQAVENLLSNAIKYSSKKENPVVEIGSYRDGNFFIFYVKDNGVGFDMKYADKLFQVFQRLHPNQEFEGTGIGLVISQNIIQRHGGKLWVDAKPGEGATFYFSLPV